MHNSISTCNDVNRSIQTCCFDDSLSPGPLTILQTTKINLAILLLSTYHPTFLTFIMCISLNDLTFDKLDELLVIVPTANEESMSTILALIGDSVIGTRIPHIFFDPITLYHRSGIPEQRLLYSCASILQISANAFPPMHYHYFSICASELVDAFTKIDLQEWFLDRLS